MAATPSIKITKSFSYRGVAHRWSNRYHFNGGTPADSAHWTTLASAIITAEKVIYPSNVTIVAWTGYAAGSEVPVASGTSSTTGTLADGGNPHAPGDAAILLRYSTTARTAKNHPIYLFNYFHGVILAAGGGDLALALQNTSIGTYAGSWITPGFSDGTNSYTRAGPNGASAVGQIVEQYITHRDFPR